MTASSGMIHAGQQQFAIHGATGADLEVVEFADPSRFAVETLLEMARSEATRTEGQSDTDLYRGFGNAIWKSRR